MGAVAGGNAVVHQGQPTNEDFDNMRELRLALKHRLDEYELPVTPHMIASAFNVQEGRTSRTR